MRLFGEGKTAAQICRTSVQWRYVLAATGLLSLLSIALGCGLEGSPQPPSLQLPKAISNLTASRVGNQVNLAWKTPRDTTDKLKLKMPVRLRICRQVEAAGCQTVATISTAPGKSATYADVLPDILVTDAPRPIHYEIFSLNRHGRAVGPSNTATVLAGQAPPQIQALSATEVERGIVLHWRSASDLAPETFVRLQRTLLTPASDLHQGKGSVLGPATEPTEQTLRVAPGREQTDPGGALDESVRFNRKYQYTATRVVSLRANGQEIDLAGTPSEPVAIATRDTFPPATPTGLVAVPVSAAINGGAPEVDLSWSANTEPDLAQYFVYRREIGDQSSAANSQPSRIAPEGSAQPIVAPAFRDFHVEPGHRYAYSVAAVDAAGNRSARSKEIEVAVPAE